MSTDDTGKMDGTDGALRRGLQVAPLSTEAMARIRAATEQEWRATTSTPQRSRHVMRRAAAAIVVLAIAGALMVGRFGGDTGAVIGKLERADQPGAVEHHWLHDHPLDNGAALHAGQRVEVQGGARIALAGAGSLRLAPGTRVKILSAHLLKLIDGSIYLDMPPTPGSQFEFSAQTPAGTFTHVGTQFLLAVHAGQTELQVREGSVRWHSDKGDVLAESGTQLIIDADGKATRTQVVTTGTTWSWAEGLAPIFEIENRSLTEFLQHVARETGRTLVFANGAVESRSATTQLHGSIDEMAPVDALATVMATTSLRFTLGGNSIRIESASDPGQTSK
ncbi:MAG: FecR domain-containing protein [Pseudomonadota bacterium]